MSKKEQIKNALIMDLEASPEHQFFNLFLDEVKASINNPNIQYNFVKYFDEPIDLNTQSVYKLISQKDLGWECIVRENLISINFIDFLKN
jgi:hypothetical protein